MPSSASTWLNSPVGWPTLLRMFREKKKERLLAEAQQLWKHQKPNAIGAAQMIERIEMLDKVALDSNILAAMFLTCRIAKDEVGSPHPSGWG
ncbi:MAG: hypothetical protein NTX42_01315 [Methanothrix sp.]|nr:hypothetical protein [Methanothrix sp.]